MSVSILASFKEAVTTILSYPWMKWLFLIVFGYYGLDFIYALIVGRVDASILDDLMSWIWKKVLQPCFRYLKRKFIEYLES